MAALRAEVAGPAPSAVERRLAERAVCCWLHPHHLEHRYAAQNGMSYDLAAHHQKGSTGPTSGTCRL